MQWTNDAASRPTSCSLCPSLLLQEPITPWAPALCHSTLKGLNAQRFCSLGAGSFVGNRATGDWGRGWRSLMPLINGHTVQLWSCVEVGLSFRSTEYGLLGIRKIRVLFWREIQRGPPRRSPGFRWEDVGSSQFHLRHEYSVFRMNERSFGNFESVYSVIPKPE